MIIIADHDKGAIVPEADADQFVRIIIEQNCIGNMASMVPKVISVPFIGVQTREPIFHIAVGDSLHVIAARDEV